VIGAHLLRRRELQQANKTTLQTKTHTTYQRKLIPSIKSNTTTKEGNQEGGAESETEA
jgi:hypothetical protein